MWLDIHVLISRFSFFFKLKHSIQASTIQSDTGWVKKTWNTRRIETGGTISHGRFKQESMLRLCCIERLDKAWITINVNTSARYPRRVMHPRAATHARVKLTLWGVILKKLIVVKILHIVLAPHACDGEFGEFTSNVWNVVVGMTNRAFWHGIKCLHSYSAVRAWRNRKVCATSCRCAFDLIVSNR